MDNPPTPPTPEPPPNPWSLLHEDSKTIITLATAFLGLTITFSDKLLVNNAVHAEVFLLISVWIILCVVAAMGIAASAEISNYLRQKTTTANSGIRYLIFSFVLLILAFALFIVFGGIQISKKAKNVDAVSTLNTSVDFLTLSYANSKGHWIPESLVWDSNAQNYQITVRSDVEQSKFLVVIDGKNGQVIRFEQKP